MSSGGFLSGMNCVAPLSGDKSSLSNTLKGDHVEKSDIYSLIVIDLKGHRQFLNTYQDKITNNRFW